MMDSILSLVNPLSLFSSLQLKYAMMLPPISIMYSTEQSARECNVSIPFPAVDYSYAVLLVAGFAMRAGSNVMSGVGYETNITVDYGYTILPANTKITSSNPTSFISGPYIATGGSALSREPSYRGAPFSIANSEYIQLTNNTIAFYIASRSTTISDKNAVTNLELDAGALFLFA